MEISGHWNNPERLLSTEGSLFFPAASSKQEIDGGQYVSKVLNLWIIRVNMAPGFGRLIRPFLTPSIPRQRIWTGFFLGQDQPNRRKLPATERDGTASIGQQTLRGNPFEPTKETI